MLKIKVKVSNITNLSEARYCAGMGVDYLSFPSTIIDSKMYREITAWITGPHFGIDANPNHFDVNEYSIDFIETTLEEIATVSTPSKYFIKMNTEKWLTQQERLLKIKDKIVALEFHSYSIDVATIHAIKSASIHFDIFLKMTHTMQLDELLALPIAGISLEGNAESKPGVKEYPLSEILEQLETD